MMDARDACTPKSNRKRQDVNANSPPPQRKSRRLAAKIPPSTKITDVNDNCLEKIFGHLGARDLFNVAVANEYLRPAAGVIYKRKFGTNQVCIKNGSPLPHPNIGGNKIYVRGLKMCLQYLRCLGPSIGSLNIQYSNWNENQCDHIHQYISEYCVESLVNIEMWDKPIGIQMKHFEKSFVNVRAVKVYFTDWDKQFSWFLQLFPNMRVLILDHVHIRTFYSIVSPFPHLEDLSIKLIGSGRSFTRDLIARLLGLCPQLQNLDIRTGNGNEIALKSWLSIIHGNRNIRNLRVNVESFLMHLDLSEIQQLIDEHPSLVELQLNGYRFTVEAVMLLIHQLASLKQLRFQIAYSEYYRIESQLDDQWDSLFMFDGNYVSLDSR